MTYDNSAVDVISGGYGQHSTGGFGDRAVKNNRIIWNEQFPFTAPGILKTVKLTWANSAGTTVTAAKIVTIRENAGTYTVTGVFTNAQLLTDAATSGTVAATYDVSGENITIAKGDFLCIGVAYSAGASGLAVPVAKSGNVLDTAEYTVANIAVTNTFTTTNIASTGQMAIEGIVSTNETIVFEDDNGAAGWGNGDTIQIPFYDADNMYIVFEKTDVPDAEDLDIQFKVTRISNGVDSVAQTLTLNFDGGANDTKITMDAFSTSKLLTAQEGEEINAHVWFSPGGDEFMCNYVNYEDGQGGEGDPDIQHISLQDKVAVGPIYSVDANAKIRRITLSQNSGTGATISRIVVCRKPVLVGCDSFTSSHNWFANNKTTLQRVGLELSLDTAFTEQRYVINGGISGGSVMKTVANATSFKERWNSEQQDLIAYWDVVFVMVNGPSLNDIIPLISDASDNDDIVAVAGRLSGDVKHIASDAISDSIMAIGDSVANDVVLCEMIPYAVAGAGLENENLAQQEFNSQLKNAAIDIQVPMAFVYDDYLANGGYSDTGTHPDAAGITWIADQIISAYENNTIPVVSGGNLLTGLLT